MKYRYITIIIFVFIASGCSKTVEEDDYYVFTIGDSKNIVLDKLIKSGVNTVRAGVDEIIEIRKSNAKDLEKLRDSRGIVFMDYRGIFARLHFEGNKVTNLHILRAAKSLNFDYFNEGQTKEEVLKKGLMALKLTDGLIAFNVEPDNQWLDLFNSTQKEKSDIKKYDTWVFHGLNDHGLVRWFHSRFVISFKEGKLRRVKHMWSYIELP